MTLGLAVLHLRDRSRRLVDFQEVYYLEAAADDTLVHLRTRPPLRDVRTLGQVAQLFEGHGFCRIHMRFMVNLRRVRAVRSRQQSADWEVVLEPPEVRPRHRVRDGLDPRAPPLS